MSDNQIKSVEELQKEIDELKTRIGRIENYILDSFQSSDPHDYINPIEDSQFDEAIRLVAQFNTASASFLQRKMSIGYARAARLLDKLEEKGIVGPADGAEPRDVILASAEKYLIGTSTNDTHNDDQLNEAIKLIKQNNTASASFLQRKMDIGYARAARLLDTMEEKGIVGPAEGAKPRKILS